MIPGVWSKEKLERRAWYCSQFGHEVGVDGLCVICRQVVMSGDGRGA